jgi:hypothetical protein
MLIFTLSGAAVVASCAAPTDYSAIQAYAKTTAQSADALAAMAADFARSCERYHIVALGLVEPNARPPQPATIVSTSPKLGAFLIAGGVPKGGYRLSAAPQLQSPAVAVGAASSAENCDGANEVSKAWNDANGALLGYVRGLGNLAGVDAVPTVNPSPLVAGLSKAGVSSAGTQAISGLISSIGAFFINEARERQIAHFLDAVNPYMPGAVGALEVTDAAYTIELESEYILTVAQYDAYARQEIAARDALARSNRDWRTTRAAMYAISARLARAKGAVEASLATIDQRLRASADYGAAVEAILKTHEELYKAAQRRASLNDYLQIVKTTGEPVVTNLTDLAEAGK